MSLKQRILEDVKTAMRAQDKPTLATLRLITASIKQREVDERIELTDDDILLILDKMLKQRRESITQFEAAQRMDLVAQEQSEMRVIQLYLPEALTDDELNSMITEAIAQAGATSAKDMGKVVAIIKPQAQGRCDMSQVSARIKAQLAD